MFDVHSLFEDNKISLTLKGLEIAEAILIEGLDPLEKKVIEALKIRSNYSFKNRVTPTTI